MEGILKNTFGTIKYMVLSALRVGILFKNSPLRKTSTASQERYRSLKKQIKTWKDLEFWKSQEWTDVKTALRTGTIKFKPDPKYVFRPLIETPLDKVKVVILGSEPASAAIDVDGLAYSYPRICSDKNLLPSSLNNIFEEYVHDTQLPFPKSGLLKKWAQKGVLLWNATPTVKRSFPGSHVGIGWHLLTNEILIECNKRKAVFLLWTPARSLYITKLLPEGALVVPGTGPGFNEVASFWGSSPFSKANAMLESIGKTPIDWKLP